MLGTSATAARTSRNGPGAVWRLSAARGAGNCSVIQFSQVQRKIHAGVRLAALKLLGDRLLDFSGFCLLANVGQSRFVDVIRNFWGTLRRRRAA